jgi:predicted SprT family Zn-dependent metalloprotease
MRKSFNMTSRANTQYSQRGEDTGRNNLSKSQIEMGTKLTKDVKVLLQDVQNEIRTIKTVFYQIKQAV